MIGLGRVASSTYPVYAMPGTQARIDYSGDGHFTVRIGAADIGTGTWTVLTQIAADALGCTVASVTLEIGDTGLPMATVVGGSAGITSWGSISAAAVRRFRDEHGTDPGPGAAAWGEMPENPDTKRFAVHSFGAQF